MSTFLHGKVLGFLLLLWSIPGVCLGQEVIVLRNGDRLTGAIKRLESGRLIITTPAVDGDIAIGWSYIDRIESPRLFRVELASGRTFLGQIEAPEKPGEAITFRDVRDNQSYPEREVVGINRTVAGLPGQLEASVGLGFALTGANRQKQYNASASGSYTGAGNFISVSLDSFFTTQEKVQDTSRHNLRAIYIRRFLPKWGVGVLSDFLKSSQQNLDLRTLLGGGPVFSLVKSNRANVQIIGGSVWNNERYSPETPGERIVNNVEALAGLQGSFFQFKEWSADTAVKLLPSLSDRGRVRFDWTAGVRLRLIRGKPLWWQVNQTLNLDNRPPAGASGVDYVTSTSINWSFP